MSHSQYPDTQEPAATQQRRKPRKGLAVTALVLGIVAICGSPIPILNNATIVAGVIGVVFATIALFGTHRVMASFGGVLAIAGIVIGIVLQVQWSHALDEIGKDLGGHSAAAKKDVTVSDCTVKQSYGMTTAQATVTVTNHTDKQQSYMATIAVDGQNGNRLGEITVIDNSLTPGQQATISGDRASTMVPTGTGQVHCTVADVDRTAG